MQKERVTEDIYVFTSDLYVQVTAGAILTTEGVVLIDSLLYPEETLQMKRFVEERLGAPIRFVINTHHHADHTTGTCFFKGATVVSNTLCQHLLDVRGRESLHHMKESSDDMNGLMLVLPEVVFEDRLTLQVGNKTLHMWSTPGHSDDSMVCLVEEDQVFFAGDTIMPLPYFVGGSFDDYLRTLHSLRGGGYENIIQGHGEVILRGEVEGKIKSDIAYLEKLKASVDKALTLSADKADSALDAISVESCGKSRVLLNGAVQQLHRQNVQVLADQRRKQLLLQTE